MMADTDPTPTKATPAAKTAAKATTTRGPGRPSAVEKLGEAVAQNYAYLGMTLGAIPHPGVQAAGVALMTQSSQLGDAWAGLAAQNPKVRAALEKALTASAVGAVVSAHLPVVLAVLASTGNLPEPMMAMFGTADPVPSPTTAQAV